MMTQPAVEHEFQSRSPARPALPDRISGAPLRAMADLLVSEEHLGTRGAVLRALSRRLAARGLSLHERTLRRYLSGAVASIPQAAEDAMVDVVVECLSLESHAEVREVLDAAGYDLPSEDRKHPLVPFERCVPLIHLWLHLNPGRSKRSLAARLQTDLAYGGIHFVTASLESLLSGKTSAVRREIHEKLLEYLAERGLTTERAARLAAEGLSEAIERSLESRKLVDAGRFQQLCQAWQLRHHAVSANGLSRRLLAWLKKRGYGMSLNRLQKSVSGQTQRVRHILEEAIEALLEAELPQGKTAEDALARVEQSSKQVTDLLWVDAKPIAAMAREWLASHPDVTARQLAKRVSKTAKKLGFERGHNAIQPVLGGWKKKTRGFVYRAMLAQFGRDAELKIPEEHLLEPVQKLTRAGVLAPEDETDSDSPFVPSAVAFLRAMREHEPSALAPSFVSFAAFRAERLYGIPRDEARAIITGAAPLPEAVAN